MQSINSSARHEPRNTLLTSNLILISPPHHHLPTCTLPSTAFTFTFNPITRARACIFEDYNLATRNSSFHFILFILFFPSSNLPMAPDLNSLSKLPRTERSQPLQTSSRSTTSSRRTSQTMGPPSVPPFAGADRVHMPHRVSLGHEQDGPLRHPRPLTAAELYSECEKEQEAVVCILGIQRILACTCTNHSIRSTASPASSPLYVHNPHP